MKTIIRLWYLNELFWLRWDEFFARVQYDMCLQMTGFSSSPLLDHATWCSAKCNEISLRLDNLEIGDIYD